MNQKDQVAAATEYARKELIDSIAYELVFHRRRKTGEKLTTGQIISDVEFDRLWGTDFSSHMSEEELEQTYLKRGDVEAACAVIDEAIKYLHDPGLKLPSNRIEVIIQEIAVGALEEQKQTISKKRGRKPEKNSARNWYIARAVEGVCSTFGLKPTRNRESLKDKHSGCSIVAAVLAEGGLPLSEVAVEKIWQDYQPSRD